MKTLLLNQSYEILHLIDWFKAVKLVLKGKVTVINSWDERINYSSGYLNVPATVRLNTYVRKPKYKTINFSRLAVFKRDNFICQYCGYALTNKDATLDHIIPKSLGGRKTFENIVTACQSCNNFKSNRTLEQANMELLSVPQKPSGYLHLSLLAGKATSFHSSWKEFISGS